MKSVRVTTRWPHVSCLCCCCLLVVFFRRACKEERLQCFIKVVSGYWHAVCLVVADSFLSFLNSLVVFFSSSSLDVPINKKSSIGVLQGEGVVISTLCVCVCVSVCYLSIHSLIVKMVL